MAHEENFDHETDLSGLDELFQAVKVKLEKSSSKYGETYWLNDINEELRQEIIDILGWTSLQALRLLTVARSQFMDLDKVYWEKFFSHQTDESLRVLKGRIDQALLTRSKEDKSEQLSEEDQKYIHILEASGYTVEVMHYLSVYPVHVYPKNESQLGGRFWDLKTACRICCGEKSI